MLLIHNSGKNAKPLLNQQMTRRTRTRPLNILRLVLLLVVGCGIGLISRCSEQGRLITPGKPAQDFRLDTLRHDRFYLNQHQGQVVVLVFWTTWCSSCKQELIALQPLSQKYSQEKLVIAAICTTPESLDTVQLIAQNLSLTYPILLDKGAKIFQQYHLRTYPTTVIIDQEGVVNFVRTGYSPVFMKQIETTLESLLSDNEKFSEQ